MNNTTGSTGIGQPKDVMCPWCKRNLYPDGFANVFGQPVRCFGIDCPGSKVMLDATEWRNFLKIAVVK